MKTDLCTDDMVVHISTPQIITAEGALGALGALGAADARGAAGESGRRLLLAARAGDTAAVRALMAKGAPFTTDWLGTSPLHVAALHAHAETVGVLLRAGVSRDARTKVERTALHVAAEAGHARVAAVLLEAGAAVDARDMLRMTPLHWAAERGHAATAALLLRAGADPHAASKFLKTPLALARRDPALLRVFEDCLKEREAARSVHALVGERAESPPPPSDLEAVQAPKAHDSKKSKQTSDRAPSKGDVKAEGGAAARLLRAHGITLLPADDGSTVLNALQSGRTVVLSDAGKLMLKESGSPQATTGASGAVEDETEVVIGDDGRGAPGVAAGAGGVVLTATPVLAPPPGVKVFTLSNTSKLSAAAARPRAEAPDPPAQGAAERGAALAQGAVRRPRAAPPVAFVQLPAGAAAGAGAGRGAMAAAALRAASARPAVKIVMSRANFNKLVATAQKASPPGGPGPAGAGDDSVVVVPEQFVRSASPQYLRSQLLCAHAALQELAAELRAAEARLALYEPAPRPDP